MFQRSLNLWLVIVCLTAGFIAGRSETQLSGVIADERKQSPEAFLSGGARSEKVLQEIHTTLNQLDARVARIEESVTKPGAAGSTKGAAR